MSTSDHPTPAFLGCATALVTPFQENQELDEERFRQLVRRQIAAGIDFLVPCGTTGETPTLRREEHLRLVAIAVEEARAAKRKVPVLAGAGGNGTAEVIELARSVQELGADGVLSVAPYYNRPTQEGLYAHFAAIAGAIDLPMVLYNVPSRTVTNLEAATTLRLARIPNIVGIKEASGKLPQISAVIAGAPPGFVVLSGDDAMGLPLVALGGQGLISVASNVAPAPVAKLVKLALEGDIAGARKLHYQYLPLLEGNFIETNPGPVKYVMSRLGLCQEVYRLPMVPVQPESRKHLDGVIAQLGLQA